MFKLAVEKEFCVKIKYYDFKNNFDMMVSVGDTVLHPPEVLITFYSTANIITVMTCLVCKT